MFSLSHSLALAPALRYKRITPSSLAVINWWPGAIICVDTEFSRIWGSVSGCHDTPHIGVVCDRIVTHVTGDSSKSHSRTVWSVELKGKKGQHPCISVWCTHLVATTRPFAADCTSKIHPLWPCNVVMAHSPSLRRIARTSYIVVVPSSEPTNKWSENVTLDRANRRARMGSVWSSKKSDII